MLYEVITSVNPEVARLVREVVQAKKPLAAVCIAPALVSRVLGNEKLAHKLTIGTDPGTAEALERMGVITSYSIHYTKLYEAWTAAS